MPPRKTTAAASAEVAQLQNIRQPSVVSQIPEDPALEDPAPGDEQEDIYEDKPDNPLSNQPTPNLAEAIMLMTEELRRRETNTRGKTKVKEPDTFDGSDPRKLNNFILLCNLYFRNNPSYSDDDARVTFALSYLRGIALEYFEPAILEADETPDWMDNWSAFIRTLRIQFGPIDPTADAEDGIDNLKMRENQCIVKYNVDFNHFAVQTGWDDSILRHRYYSGLAEHIKDIMGQQGKPATLEAMKTLAHHIDARHWERLREKSRSDKSKPDNNRSDNSKSDKKPNNNQTSNNNSNNSNNTNNSNKKNNNSNNNNRSGKQSSASGSSVAPDKLGKDGKLTPQERQRRFDNNLCMFCGGVGHVASGCPKSNSSASKAKARAAQASEKPKESSDSKKV